MKFIVLTGAARKLVEIANGVEAVQDGPRLKQLHVSISGAFRQF
jgi:hypothetical protein